MLSDTVSGLRGFQPLTVARSFPPLADRPGGTPEARMNGSSRTELNCPHGPRVAVGIPSRGAAMSPGRTGTRRARGRGLAALPRAHRRL